MADHDNPLERALREGLADRTEDLEIPTGMGARGRTIARRRTARRAAVATAPVLAAIVVVAVLLAGGSSGPTVASARVVIHNVRAALARLGQSDGVVETVATGEHDWSYTEPDGTNYTNSQYSLHGKVVQIYWDEVRPLTGGEFSDTQLKILVTARTWDQTRVVTDHLTSNQPTVTSTAKAIGSALKSGKVSYRGRVTLNGRPALELQLAKGQELYVDPQTYRPIQETSSHDGKVVVTLYLRPATAANIAHAVKRPTIPKGFRRLHRTEAAKGTAAGAGAALAGLAECQTGSTPGRILEYNVDSRVLGAYLTLIQQYTDPKTGVCSTLTERYPSIGSQETDISWRSGRPGGPTRQVDVDKLKRTYTATSTTGSASSMPSLSIESSAAEVRQAVANGTATRGKLIKALHGTHELTVKLPPTASRPKATLYVDPSSYAPLVEDFTYLSNGYRFGIAAYFDPASRKAVSRIVKRPARPSGYKSGK